MPHETLERVTVVIPCYNAAAFIARAVDSVLAQDPSAALVVIDDGSSDGSAAVLACYGDRIVVKSVPNGGAARARNHGLALAATDYVLFLDADDHIAPGSLAAWTAVADAEGADMVFGPFATERDGVLTPGGGAVPGRDLLADWLDGRGTPPCAVLWRRVFLERIGGWRPLLRNQDGELGMRALIEGARVAFAHEGLGVWVHHDGPGRISRRKGVAVIGSEYEAIVDVERLALARGMALGTPLALAYYKLAYRGYAIGADKTADRALARARRLNFRGHAGSFQHRVLATIFGLRTKMRLATRLHGRAVERMDENLL